ncbi:uncharacterized protein C630.12-like isoform X5 [Panicum virgatum]|uniref:uncharacterized protein C630.12-like isoform X5 n=1 Tax=Panicum virgatum TaxID=38727 RepID=UPI0019D6371D|nr:uncharacterized protein C630.12-like isoform X5 [Panicum virgatum]
MQSATRLTLLLCAAWAATVLYGEMGAYWASYVACSWPSPSPSSSPPNNHVKIAVVADPQLMDSTSLGLPSSSIALQAAEFYTDLNMRRSFQSAILPFDPDMVLFLGDHFDGGPYMSNEECLVGMKKNLDQETTNFLLERLTLLSLMLKHLMELKRAKKGPPLGSSLKLYPQRVSYAALDQGITYQNYLTKETSDLLLSLLKPVLVLSGHDHDQCTVVHSTPFGPVTEHTLGTISWQQGNLYPSFMLLSAGPKLSQNSTDLKHEVMTNLCFLPKQTHIYIWYICQFAVTFVLLVFWPTNGLSSVPYMNAFVSFMRSVGAELFSRTKEKDDEEDGEYEMVFDAEGSMHLVKKAVAKVSSASSDSRTVGRGNVVARATAGKHQLEPDSSILVEMGSEVISEDGARLARPSKSKVRKVLQRLFRVIQSIVVIAALNVPLYMMLLFKDWIDH